jgi:transposase, IS5 family
MKLDPNNRWVKKAELIPWTEIETEYTKLFKGIKGHVAVSARMALGVLLIQTEYGYSDKDTVEQIQENPYLQFFCDLPGYKYERPFDASVMVRFRKRLSADKLTAINECIIRKAEDSRKEKDDNDQKNQLLKNRGTVIVDAICAPSQIKYPSDTELLNEAREKTGTNGSVFA